MCWMRKVDSLADSAYSQAQEAGCTHMPGAHVYVHVHAHVCVLYCTTCQSAHTCTVYTKAPYIAVYVYIFDVHVVNVYTCIYTRTHMYSIVHLSICTIHLFHHICIYLLEQMLLFLYHCTDLLGAVPHWFI